MTTNQLIIKFMKITKILIVALSLTFFSCSKEENGVVNTNEAGFTLKNGGLTEIEVNQLKSDCLIFSTSSEFLNMRAKAKAFSEKLKYNQDPSISYPSSRQDMEKWLNTNLSISGFTTVQEGLDMYDDLDSLAEIFYKANDSFFDKLSGATDTQLQTILEPIEPEFPIEPTDTECDKDCVEQGLNYVDFATYSYNYMIGIAEQTGDSQYITIAESSLADSLHHAAYLTISCFEECDEK